MDNKAIEAAARAIVAAILEDLLDRHGIGNALEEIDVETRIELEETLRGIAKEEIEAHLAASGDGWQPIETAPKDGTKVLACLDWDDIQIVVQFMEGQWVTAWSGEAVEQHLEEPLNYWQPLPALPTKAARG